MFRRLLAFASISVSAAAAPRFERARHDFGSCPMPAFRQTAPSNMAGYCRQTVCAQLGREQFAMRFFHEHLQIALLWFCHMLTYNLHVLPYVSRQFALVASCYQVLPDVNRQFAPVASCYQVSFQLLPDVNMQFARVCCSHRAVCVWRCPRFQCADWVAGG